MKSDIEKKLSRALKQFSLNTLFDDVCPYFSRWVTRDRLSSEIRRLRRKPDTASAVGILINLLKDQKVENADIEEILPTVLLLGTALNCSRKTWTTYTLEGNCSREKFEHELEDELKHHLLQNDLNAAVVVKSVESMHWVQVTEKKLIKNRLKVYAPFYVAHFIGEPYMFSNKKETSHEFLQALSESFGYTGYKFSNLNGHDLESMLKHLKQKGTKRGFARPLSTLGQSRSTPYGTDFSQHENRRKFVSDMMGASPPKLSNYVVVAKNLPWKGRLQHPSMKTKAFDMKIEFQTEDTVDMLLDMAEDGCLKVPPPSYVVNLLSTGRNNIKLRVQNGPGATDTENQTDA